MMRPSRESTETHAARVIDSPVGRLYLAATERGLTHLRFVARMDHGPEEGEGSAQAADSHLRVFFIADAPASRIAAGGGKGSPWRYCPRSTMGR